MQHFTNDTYTCPCCQKEGKFEMMPHPVKRFDVLFRCRNCFRSVPEKALLPAGLISFTGNGILGAGPSTYRNLKQEKLKIISYKTGYTYKCDGCDFEDHFETTDFDDGSKEHRCIHCGKHYTNDEMQQKAAPAMSPHETVLKKSRSFYDEIASVYFDSDSINIGIDPALTCCDDHRNIKEVVDFAASIKVCKVCGKRHK